MHGLSLRYSYYVIEQDRFNVYEMMQILHHPITINIAKLISFAGITRHALMVIELQLTASCA